VLVTKDVGILVGGALNLGLARLLLEIEVALVFEALVLHVIRLVVERVTLHGVSVARATAVVHHILVRMTQWISTILTLLERSRFGHTLCVFVI